MWTDHILNVSQWSTSPGSALIGKIYIRIYIRLYDLLLFDCSSTQQELWRCDAGRHPDAVWHGRRSPGTPSVVPTPTDVSWSDSEPATWGIHHATAASLSTTANAWVWLLCNTSLVLLTIQMACLSLLSALALCSSTRWVGNLKQTVHLSKSYSLGNIHNVVVH